MVCGVMTAILRSRYIKTTIDMAEDYLTVRLKRDIKSVSTAYPKGTVVPVKRDVRGHVHIVGYKAMVLNPGDYEPAWNDEDLDQLLTQ